MNVRAFLWALPALLLATGCAQPTADNLLLISFDTTRADRLSCYGFAGNTTPNIDALASRGARFERAYSHVPSTLPAHSSIFTGLLPPAHGVRCNGYVRLSDERTTLAEILRDHGFSTGAVIGALPIAARFGIDQGFEFYDDRFDSHRSSGSAVESEQHWFGHLYKSFERSADEVTDRALEWLDDADDRWFLFVHYFDPHRPFEPPEEWLRRFDHPYEAEIAFADHHLGRLLEAVKHMPGRTLIVFTADHGEGMGDHGEHEHGRFLFDSTVRVPLILSLEGKIDTGRNIRSTVAHIDLLPTLLELLDLEAPEGVSGRSLAPALLDGGEPGSRPVYVETFSPTLEMNEGIVLRALIDGGRKLIRTDVDRLGERYLKMELYDLDHDPGELTDRARGDLETLRTMGRALDGWSRTLADAAPDPEFYEMDEETRDALESLGYLK